MLYTILAMQPISTLTRSWIRGSGYQEFLIDQMSVEWVKLGKAEELGKPPKKRRLGCKETFQVTMHLLTFKRIVFYNPNK